MYGKVFAQIYDGSLYGHWQALVTFQQMIVLSDAKGVLDMTPEALSARTSIPLEIIRAGIADLEAPDPSSRTPGHEGRRIVRLSKHREWGWRIVNHRLYRKTRTEQERRDYMRAYQRERRRGVTRGDVGKGGEPVGVNSCKPCKVNATAQVANSSTTSGVSMLTPVNSGKQNQPIAVSRSSKQKKTLTPYSEDFESGWLAYPKRPNNSKAEAWRAWRARLKAGEDPAQMLAGIRAYAAYVRRERTEPRFVKHAATFLGPDRHYLNDFSPPETAPDAIEWMDEAPHRNGTEAAHGRR